MSGAFGEPGGSTAAKVGIPTAAGTRPLTAGGAGVAAPRAAIAGMKGATPDRFSAASTTGSFSWHLSLFSSSFSLSLFP